jgi:two-component system phosphate regulon sensor histidine kinase PhoR
MKLRNGRYFWKLFLGNAVLLGLVLGTSVWLILHELEQFYRRELVRHLATVAIALQPVVEDKFDSEHMAELDALAKKIGLAGEQGIRITFLDVSGVVLGDSDSDPAHMESHADRPEIIEALKTGQGIATRWSHSVACDFKYVATRIGPAEAPDGVVRVSMAVQTIGLRTQAARELTWKITWVSLLAALALALGLARLWSNRVRRITEAARAIARGDLNAKVTMGGADEVAFLATVLNQMRKNLASQLSTIDRQRRVLESLLGQLQEGVVVVGVDGAIVLVNPAAATLLGLMTGTDFRAEQLKGRLVEQCIRHHDLQRMLVREAPLDRGEVTGPPKSTVSNAVEATLEDSVREAQFDVECPDGVVSVLARVSDIVLPDQGDDGVGDAAVKRPTLGRLLALTDITQLVHTIRVKTDFVTNASHELRTPLSAIRAAVETLLNFDASDSSASRDRFLEVIDRHSARLESMVADLLDLARSEQGRSRFSPSALSLRKVFADLSRRWADSVEKKGLQWGCKGDGDVVAFANPELLRLVLDNLVHNAIKFTPPSGAVEVSCRDGGERVTIEVADTGCGIAPDDQKRVFERFYQVAIARSGAGGRSAEDRGTGLGLAIVRHAVAAMDGTIRVESKLGHGTRMIVTIPNAKQSAVRA